MRYKVEKNVKIVVLWIAGIDELWLNEISIDTT